MSSKKVPGKPKLPKVLTYSLWLQYSEQVGSMPTLLIQEEPLAKFALCNSLMQS